MERLIHQKVTSLILDARSRLPYVAEEIKDRELEDAVNALRDEWSDRLEEAKKGRTFATDELCMWYGKAAWLIRELDEQDREDVQQERWEMWRHVQQARAKGLID